MPIEEVVKQTQHSHKRVITNIDLYQIYRYQQHNEPHFFIITIFHVLGDKISTKNYNFEKESYLLSAHHFVNTSHYGQCIFRTHPNANQ